MAVCGQLQILYFVVKKQMGTTLKNVYFIAKERMAAEQTAV